MRDMYKELMWFEHPIIGYVPIDEQGNPYQPINGRGRHTHKKPVTIYKTMARAVTYSPCNSATEVRMFEPISKEV
tara:strand:- start:39 stop:263 length:225 start_codon:yes stop_codon:yes gene_type:complete